MKKAFKKFDNKILKNHPIAWILGLHLFVPGLVILHITLWLIGYLNSKIENYAYNSIPYQEINAQIVIAVFLAIALLIMYFIRQLRFNSKRILHTLPSNYYLKFLVGYIVVFTLLLSLPTAHVGGTYVQIKNDNYFKIVQKHQDEILSEQALLDLKVEHEKDLSVEATERNRLNRLDSLIPDVENFHNYFAPLSWSFWKIFLLFPLFVSVLLLMICSVNKSDLGWAALIVFLTPVAFGLFLALINLGFGSNNLNDIEDTSFVILILFVILFLLLGFGTFLKAKKSLRNGFAIALHIFIPTIIVLSYFLLNIYKDYRHYNKEHPILVILYVSTIMSIALFKFYSINRYVNPN